jgi:hypothetical protein
MFKACGNESVPQKTGKEKTAEKEQMGEINGRNKKEEKMKTKKVCTHEKTIGLTDRIRWCDACGAVQIDHRQLRRDWMLPKRERGKK